MRISNVTLRSAVWVVAVCVAAQTPTKEAKGLPPRAAPTDYQAQAKAGAVTIAAEFTGHAVPTADGVYNTEDYVVVEAALFGAPEAQITLAPEDFSLRINGKKAPQPSVSSVLVIKSLKDPNWEPPVSAESKSKSSFGTGKSQGDPPPPPPKMPIELQHAMSLRVQNAAMMEGNRTLPQAGLLFFEYRGKAQSIRSLELIYHGSAGQATLTLQP